MRVARRRVREELRSNLFQLERTVNFPNPGIPMRQYPKGFQLEFSVWTKDQGILIEDADAEPHRLAAEAYRRLEVIDGKRTGGATFVATSDYSQAKKGVETAINALDEADQS